MAQLVRRVALAMEAVFDSDGLLVIQRNRVLAEQTVPHLDVHDILRREETHFPPDKGVEVTLDHVRAERAGRLGSAMSRLRQADAARAEGDAVAADDVDHAEARVILRDRDGLRAR